MPYTEADNAAGHVRGTARDSRPSSTHTDPHRGTSTWPAGAVDVTTSEKSSGARIVSLDYPRYSARAVVDLRLASPEILAGLLDRLIRQVGRDTKNMPVNKRTVYITYEEAVEWEQPPAA